MDAVLDAVLEAHCSDTCLLGHRVQEDGERRWLRLEVLHFVSSPDAVRLTVYGHLQRDRSYYAQVGARKDPLYIIQCIIYIELILSKSFVYTYIFPMFHMQLVLYYIT